MNNIADAARFCMAVVVGGIYELWFAARLRLWVVSTALRNMRLNRNNNRIIQLKAARIAKCQKCPIYFRPLKTCGSPLQLKPMRLPSGKRAGCYCYIPFKAADPEACCWAYDEYNQLNLPVEMAKQLMPFMWAEDRDYGRDQK